jgi:hypothetical protein
MDSTLHMADLTPAQELSVRFMRGFSSAVLMNSMCIQAVSL